MTLKEAVVVAPSCALDFLLFTLALPWRIKVAAVHNVFVLKKVRETWKNGIKQRQLSKQEFFACHASLTTHLYTTQSELWKILASSKRYSIQDFTVCCGPLPPLSEDW